MAQSNQTTVQARAGYQSASAKDLSTEVYSELLRRRIPSPELDVIVELFEVMYFASLKTEESKPVAFHVVYLNPENPDPEPPSVTVHNRWSCVRLAKPVALRGADFLKIAIASDPRTSSFAVHEDNEGHLVVWGLIDQGNSYHDYLNFDSQTGPERPGLFQASILGTAHLVAFIEYEKVAELKQGTLLRSAIDVLQSGPIRKALEPGIRSHLGRVERKTKEFFSDEPLEWQPAVVEDWTCAIRRLLLRVQNIRHGGAFLITPDESTAGLSVKYKIAYDRLRSSLERQAVNDAEHFAASDDISDEYLEKDADDMPVALHVAESVSGYYLEEIRSELDGAIWFTSLLTRVDGLVLLNSELEVQGFGVEITFPKMLLGVFIARDAAATESRLKKVNYRLYGTRHRSMMRYCANVPGSVGFVVSQDGDVRVMTRVGDRLIMWDNIRLQLPKFVRRKKKRRRFPRTA